MPRVVERETVTTCPGCERLIWVREPQTCDNCGSSPWAPPGPDLTVDEACAELNKFFPGTKVVSIRGGKMSDEVAAVAEPVTLTATEVSHGALCGMRRHLASLQDGRQDRHGADTENGWTLHIEGACGELAFAKLFGMYWSPSINTFKLPDVGRVQVRTRSRHDYELIVRADDDDAQLFALMTGRAPNFVFRGAIAGKFAKQEKFRREHGGREAAYFVPQAELLSLRDAQDSLVTL